MDTFGPRQSLIPESSTNRNAGHSRKKKSREGMQKFKGQCWSEDQLLCSSLWKPPSCFSGFNADLKNVQFPAGSDFQTTKSTCISSRHHLSNFQPLPGSVSEEDGAPLTSRLVVTSCFCSCWRSTNLSALTELHQISKTFVFMQTTFSCLVQTKVQVSIYTCNQQSRYSTLRPIDLILQQIFYA